MIGLAVQKGSSVHVYSDKNRLLFILNAGSGKGDGLKGYTSSTVNIQRGNSIYIYNEQGRLVGTQFAK